MLDVIHVFLEDDNIPKLEQHLEMKSAVRTSIYQNIYNQVYKYPVKSREASQQKALGFDEDMALPDLPPDQQQVKPYFPPTDVEDLPGILDAPLG